MHPKRSSNILITYKPVFEHNLVELLGAPYTHTHYKWQTHNATFAGYSKSEKSFFYQIMDRFQLKNIFYVLKVACGFNVLTNYDSNFPVCETISRQLNQEKLIFHRQCLQVYNSHCIMWIYWLFKDNIYNLYRFTELRHTKL